MNWELISPSCPLCHTDRPLHSEWYAWSGQSFGQLFAICQASVTDGYGVLKVNSVWPYLLRLRLFWTSLSRDHIASLGPDSFSYVWQEILMRTPEWLVLSSVCLAKIGPNKTQMKHISLQRLCQGDFPHSASHKCNFWMQIAQNGSFLILWSIFICLMQAPIKLKAYLWKKKNQRSFRGNKKCVKDLLHLFI